MKKVLVFGAAGFIGRYFIDYITRNNLDKHYSFVYTFRKTGDFCDSGAWVHFDYEQGVCVEEFIKQIKPDYILNLIGTYSSSSVADMIKINTQFSMEIMKALKCLDMGNTRLLLIGSAAEYGNNPMLPLMEKEHLSPLSEYGLSKKLQTEAFDFYVANYGINSSIARTFNVIGRFAPACLSIGYFYDQIIRAKEVGGEIKVGNIRSRRDFLDLRDVVDAYWRILLDGKSGEVYNVCSGQSVKMEYVLNQMILESAKSIKVIAEEVSFSKNDVTDSYGDNSKLIKELGWTPTVRIEESLSALFEKQ